MQEPAKYHENQLLEVLRAVGRTEGQPSRQIAAGSSENGHLLSPLRLVVDLVKSFLSVANTDEPASGDCRLQSICVRDDDEAPVCDLVKGPVVDDHPPAALNGLVAGLLLRRKRGEAPQRGSFGKLASRHILRNSLLDPLRVWAVQAVQSNPHGAPSR